MEVLTEPIFLLRGLRNSQALSKQELCHYELLGWKNSTLFYRSRCPDGETQTWKYDADSSYKSIRYNGSLPVDLITEQVSPNKFSKSISLYNVYPREAQSSLYLIFLSEPSLTSSNRKFIALISQHIYSIEDVIVFESGNAYGHHEQN